MHFNGRTGLRLVFGSIVALGISVICWAQEQYPKPLAHTSAEHPAVRVLLLTVDGLHAIDLANWVAAHPHSALAELSKRGVTYTNAHSPIANIAAGMAAVATGGTPISTGIIAPDGYDRALSPPGSACATVGTHLNPEAEFDGQGRFDPGKAPLDPRHGCTPLPPHRLLRVNTIFEVVREKIGPTAWAGESPGTTELLRGPSGQGLSRSCCDAAGSSRDADRERLAAVLGWIDGKDEDGDSIPVPTLFGMSFASLTTGPGYSDTLATPSPGFEDHLHFLDDSIDRIVQELKRRRLFDSTWIFVVAPFGRSPMNAHEERPIPLASIRKVVESAAPGSMLYMSGGNSVMIWLRDPTTTAPVANRLGDSASLLGIQDVLAGTRLSLTLNSPQMDSRMPDIVLQGNYGVRWTVEPAELETAGGWLDEETHVALLVSGTQLTGRRDPTWVPITQVAPLLLRALGMEKFDLLALHIEHSPALPGIF